VLNASSLPGDAAMPIVHIHMVKGRSIEKKRELVEKVTSAVTETIGVVRDTVEVLLHECEVENVAKGGILFADSRK
jgi:4-oxalocrotonate tautomerase